MRVRFLRGNGTKDIYKHVPFHRLKEFRLQAQSQYMMYLARQMSVEHSRWSERNVSRINYVPHVHAQERDSLDWREYTADSFSRIWMVFADGSFNLGLSVIAS